jgi:crossover junction endodeoxyribonuclease RuvC
LRKIYEFLEELIKTHKPDALAVESLFFEKNAKTAIDVAAARGVILLVGELAGLPIAQYTPLQVKSALTGYGKADKSQVEFMVGKILHLKEKIKPDDAAEAVAIALTHAFRVR